MRSEIRFKSLFKTRQMQTRQYRQCKVKAEISLLKCVEMCRRMSKNAECESKYQRLKECQKKLKMS